MYVIVVYDINQARVGKVCQFLRRYLNWVQNSAFEGELTLGQLERIRTRLLSLIEKEEDSVYFYILRSRKWARKEVLGVEKNLTDNVL
jgi:CRISPR-associated protein Cas2